VLYAAQWKYRAKMTQKSLPAESGYIFATEVCTTIGKNVLNSNIFSTCSHDMANFGSITAAEIA